MNTTGRTFVFLAVAAVAFLASMGVQVLTEPKVAEGFSEVGQEFFPDFQDPLKARELSVAKFDADNSEVQIFTVKQNDNGIWVIPSHHNYPAEAAERLAKTAASLIGVRKVAIQSRSNEDWARYGVADPNDKVVATLDKSEDKDPRGTRVSLRDASGNALVDLIVGFPVKGRDKHYYVRIPDKNPVFVAKLDADLSAKFSDWIEPDLLKLNSTDIVRVMADRYTYDEAKAEIVPGEILSLSKDVESNKWALDGMNGEVEQVKEAVISDLNRNLDQLKIVGVRPKPRGINSNLTITREVAESPELQRVLQIDLMRQGYFIRPDQENNLRLWSNEGELIAGTRDGVSYTLYFGEIARGSAKDIETGLNEAKPEEASKDGEKTASESLDEAKKKAEEEAAGPRRYLLVKVEYDESLLGPKPMEPTEPEKPAILNEETPAATNPAADAAKEGAAPAPEAKPEADAPAEPAKEALSADAPATENATEPKPEEAAKEEAPKDPGSCDEGSPAAVQAEPTQDASAPAQESPATPTATQEPVATQDPAAASPEPATDTPAPATAQDDAKPADQPAASGNDAAAPQEAPAQQQPPVDPKAEAQKQYDQAMLEYKSAKAAYERNLKAWEERAKEGKKKADELKARFEAWYYVISAESFDKFALSRAALVEPKAAPAADGANPSAEPAIPGFQLPGQN